MELLQAMGYVLFRPLHRPAQAPRADHAGGQDGSLVREDATCTDGYFLPADDLDRPMIRASLDRCAAAIELEPRSLLYLYFRTEAEVRLPGDDAGDGGGGAGDGRRDDAAPAVAAAVRAQQRVDPGAAGGGGERADAPDDVHGGVAAAVVRAGAGGRGAGRLLQRLLRGVPAFAQAGAPHCGIPGGGGHPLLHGVPQRLGGRQDRERAGSCHSHRLLAPPGRRHPQGRRHGHPRRRGPPPRCQPLRLRYPLPGT